MSEARKEVISLLGGSEEQPAGSDCKPTGRYGRTAGRRCYE